MKSVPTGLSYVISENSTSSIVMHYMYSQHLFYKISYADFDAKAKYLSLCDRLDSLGCTTHYQSTADEGILDYIGDHFKIFAKAFKENPEISLVQFVESNEKKLFFEKHNITPNEKHSLEFYRLLYRHCRFWPAEKIKLTNYFFDHNQLDVFFSVSTAFRFIDELFEIAAIIDYEVVKKDFFRQYIMVREIYDTNKIKFNNKKLFEQYAKHSHIWNYQNDEFFIKIPSSVEDFRKEAEDQHNCLYRGSYIRQVLSGETNIIFIRRKSEPEKSFITCEITPDGTICQYFLKRNAAPWPDTPEAVFRRELEKFIEENW